MGEVYRARDTRLNRDGAVKVLPQAFDTDAARERFQREARAASSLNHPNICAIYDVGEAAGPSVPRDGAAQRIWNGVQLPGIRAAIEIKRDQPVKAVELLASASPYERAYPESIYLRGSAYLRLHKGAEAAAEFQKILDHKGANWGFDWRYPNWGQYYSLSYLGLAHGSALAGDTAKARKAYEDFFAVWIDADQDLPILIAAKKDYAALQALVQTQPTARAVKLPHV